MVVGDNARAFQQFQRLESGFNQPIPNQPDEQLHHRHESHRQRVLSTAEELSSKNILTTERQNFPIRSNRWRRTDSSKQRVNFPSHDFIHANQRWPGAFEAPARSFLRRINTEFAAVGDFDRASYEDAPGCVRCGLLFLFHWRDNRCRQRRRGGKHRRRGGRGKRLRDGGVMPMAVLDGPHFSRRYLARRLRRGCGFLLRLLGRHGEGLRLRCSTSSGSSRLLWRRRSLRLGKNVGTCRSNDHTTRSGQRDHKTERRSLF